jgi:Fe-S cluster assembly protein SufD
MNTKPELEIYADDVKCSHGATTGQLDDEALFYMRSRGIPASCAKALLIEAFIAELFEEITSETMREDVSSRVSTWLNGQV